MLTFVSPLAKDMLGVSVVHFYMSRTAVVKHCDCIVVISIINIMILNDKVSWHVKCLKRSSFAFSSSFG